MRYERGMTRVYEPTLGVLKLAKRLGRSMREQRELAGVGVFDMARKIGVMSTSLKAMERGSLFPSIPTLYLYADVCGVTLQEVLP